LEALRALRDRLMHDELVRPIWNEYEVSGPLIPNVVTIDSPVGRFTYQTLTLPFAGTSGIVVQVPNSESEKFLA
jgi:hypothetical protein